MSAPGLYLVPRYLFIFGSLLGVLAWATVGCAPPRPTQVDTVTQRPLRLDALPGSTHVLPLAGDWPAMLGADDSGRVSARLDSGGTVQVRAARLVVEAVLEPAGEGTRRHSWLPTPGVWTSSPITRERDGTLADQRGTTRVLVIDMPSEAAGTELLVCGRRVPINWITPASADSPEGFWEPTLTRAAAVSPSFSALEWPESTTPLGRWRHRLLTDGLRPALLDSPAIKRFEDPVVEAWASQNEARWAAALERLALENPELAGRLRQRLTDVVEFAEGVVAPAWPTDHVSMDRLLADLLDPGLDAPRRASRAEAWIEDQPAAVAWIIDDAGVAEAALARPLVSVGVANLTERATLAWASTEESAPAQPIPLAPWSSRMVRAVAPGEGGVVRIHVGAWSRELPVATGTIPVEPPGVVIGAFLPDFAMADFLENARPPAPRETWATAALLDARTAPRGNDFELYVECRFPEGMEPGVRDAVRVYLGPTPAPRSILKIDATGAISEEARRADLVPTPPPPRVQVARDRWSFRVQIPREAIEADGTLRLGMTRTDPLGRRQAWPRPMLPWQTDPGRVMLNTKAW